MPRSTCPPPRWNCPPSKAITRRLYSTRHRVCQMLLGGPFMDQKKNQGQQSDRSQGQQRQSEERSHGQDPQPHEKEQHDMPSSGSRDREKGRGGQGERNLGGGISNRDMD